MASMPTEIGPLEMLSVAFTSAARTQQLLRSLGMRSSKSEALF